MCISIFHKFSFLENSRKVFEKSLNLHKLACMNLEKEPSHEILVLIKYMQKTSLNVYPDISCRARSLILSLSLSLLSYFVYVKGKGLEGRHFSKPSLLSHVISTKIFGSAVAQW